MVQTSSQQAGPGYRCAWPQRLARHRLARHRLGECVVGRRRWGEHRPGGRRLVSGSRAASALTYALLTGLITLTALALVNRVGDGVHHVADDVADTLIGGGAARLVRLDGDPSALTTQGEAAGQCVLLTLGNQGRSASGPLAASLAGPDFALAGCEDTCSGQSLLPNATCRIGVRLQAQGNGTLSGTLTVSAPQSEEALILALSGQASGLPEACLRRGLDHPQGEPTTCFCPSERAASAGSVIGSGPYSAASDVCRAAVHAGVTGVQGGVVTFTHASLECPAFNGFDRHGVRSNTSSSAAAILVFAGQPESCAIAGGPCPSVDPEDFAADLVHRCTCSASQAGSGSVIGSAPYDEDSSLCRAALHAGQVSAEGGEISFRRSSATCPYFIGTDANGVQSSWSSSADRSFVFDGLSEDCAAQPQVGIAQCPDSPRDLPRDAAVRCLCDANQTGGGSVIGSGPYEDDSRLCRAAVHAGAITTDGGMITATRHSLPTCSYWRGSLSNGVESQWRSHGNDRVTINDQSPDCAAQPQAGISYCPSSPRDIPRDEPITCLCQADQTHSGSVIGSGPYEDDTRICRGALHAGEIGGAGGMVRITRHSGATCPQWRGSLSNGVESQWRDHGNDRVTYGSQSADCGAQPQAGVESCPNDPRDLERDVTKTCFCRADQTSSGSVIGSGPYEDDSRVCRAAAHAGVVGNGGEGTITVTRLSGATCPQWRGSVSNGIRSQWRDHGNDRVIFGGQSGSCGAQPQAGSDYCPSSVRTIQLNVATTCYCEPGDGLDGSVVGGGPYEDDSRICRAAAHAGSVTGISAGGAGLVTVTRGRPGCEDWFGSVSNGIEGRSRTHGNDRFWFSGMSSACSAMPQFGAPLPYP